MKKQFTLSMSVPVFTLINPTTPNTTNPAYNDVKELHIPTKIVSKIYQGISIYIYINIYIYIYIYVKICQCSLTTSKLTSVTIRIKSVI